MKNSMFTLFFTILICSFSIHAERSKLTVEFDRGLKLSSDDGNFNLKIGGRIMSDWAFFSPSDNIEAFTGVMEDGAEFRRARFYISGTLYRYVEFKAEYDFAGGDADFKDVFLGLKQIVGKAGLRVGHFKEPFSLEELTSSNHITFIERALPVEAFAPSRNTGFMLHRTDARFSWGAGIFKEADDFGNAEDNVSDSAWALTGRIAGTPYFNNEGKSMLHLGLSFTSRDPVRDSVRIRTRPEMHLSPGRFVDTLDLDADGYQKAGFEFALVQGPFSIQAEYIQASVDLIDGESGDFSGYYAYVSYYFTGESRKYKQGKFDRLIPVRNLFRDGGVGAWEIALRYSAIDLTDGRIVGGEESNVTLGLNWYLNPNMKVMWNYVNADVDSVGDVDAFMMRWQIDF